MKDQKIGTETGAERSKSYHTASEAHSVLNVVVQEHNASRAALDPCTAGFVQ